MILHQLLSDCRYSDSLIPIQQHFHSDYEMIYIKSGIAHIQFESRTYRLQKGSLVFVNQLENHSITILSNNYERYYVIFSSDHLDDLLPNPRFASIFRNRTDFFCPVYDMSSKASVMEFCFSSILKEYLADEEYAIINFNAYMSIIFTTVFRLYPDAFSLIAGSFSDDIFMIQRYIEDHYNEDIHISEIANNYFISPQYLSRRFKQQTGYSPKQYLTNVRLAKAKSLLINTTLPITVIANQCGFNDVNNFIRFFREREHTTPNKFRSKS